MSERIFTVRDVVKFSNEKAKVTQLSVTEHSIVFVWGVRPGQQVETHIHPKGQDTWIVVQGELTYYLGNGETRKIAAGQIDIAPKNEIHGCVNEGSEDAIFISIYSPKEIGYETAQR
jgi:quercetin dioxygenase-like cupin family protein